ncbi:tetratricopeptide repeat protein [Lactiplantibacillus modestisalitolerans]|uniref:Tetratricopeptide repeat protein n=1 Tax=Lactiplantibacillus modestisalitolerans TaxID=1457219 RepID=A0ABV5WTF1_9LACO|nr:tetratricopeptide repeat protein [Lactiplantibacillus modestisalitolerans]
MAKNKRPSKAQQQALVHQLVATIDAHPDDYQPYYELVVLLTAGQDFEQAEELAMKALGKFDQQPQAADQLRYALGNVYYQAQEYDRALPYYQQITDQQLRTDAYLMMAQSLMAKRDYQHALVYALTAQESRKNDYDANLLVADILLAMGNNQQAFDYYQNAFKLDPHSGKAAFNAGLTAMVVGQPYADWFAKAQALDATYYQQHQQQLTDIEKMLASQRTNQQDDAQ